ncbi:uncharacterized protein RAG0_01725 [Rhynchosporium agropyri]|uniref:UspA domain-containing protein n=1 Tax=Rhynchosporium agropyri TaxID=914238 RepID=A0A1E1JYD5_9HELO|nr:uncharacterized protein RAG0_01725 [Rhynchosporium agropyri]
MALTDDSSNSRFQHHVSFDNFAGGEGTAKNSTAFTLNMKHRGYQRKRRSRTFMVGVDENDYSDIALSWMLEELVDDGDEVVCLRVVDKDAKVVNDRNVDNKSYQDEAKKLMARIVSQNDENKAIHIVLEFAVGKVHAVFQKMIQLYEPAMLIVGTRGRSLGGFQALMQVSNSFSKWCLQYSPIPVVVVRPTEKRNKKKKKRDADTSRQDYARILKESGLEVHESDDVPHNSIFEDPNTAEVEAHAVADALGLPVKYDPAMKPFVLDGRNLRKVESATSDRTSISPDSRPTSPGLVRKNSKGRRESARRESTQSCDNTSVSGDESSYGEQDEFEAVSGHDLIKNGHGNSRVRLDTNRVVKWTESTSDAAANAPNPNDADPESEGYMSSDDDELWSQGTAGTFSNATKQKNLDGLFLILEDRAEAATADGTKPLVNTPKASDKIVKGIVSAARKRTDQAWKGIEEIANEIKSVAKEGSEGSTGNAIVVFKGAIVTPTRRGGGKGKEEEEQEGDGQ